MNPSIWAVSRSFKDQDCPEATCEMTVNSPLPSFCPDRHIYFLTCLGSGSVFQQATFRPVSQVSQAQAVLASSGLLEQAARFRSELHETAHHKATCFDSTVTMDFQGAPWDAMNRGAGCMVTNKANVSAWSRRAVSKCLHAMSVSH